MEQISNDKLVDAINHVKELPEFKKFITNCKKRLSNFQKGETFNYYKKEPKKKKVSKPYDFSSDVEVKEYVDLLVKNISDIMYCDVNEMKKWKNKFDEIDLSKIAPEIKTGFFQEIQKRLKYKELRSGDDNLLFKFYQQLSVKACVYCNSQHVILLKSIETARLQADHNLPKSEYPCFAITLANLYPSCNNCNHLKGDKTINYNLYYTKKPQGEIEFKLDPVEIAKFYNNQLHESDLNLKFNQGSTLLESVLNINEIYENHKDYAADLLRNHKIYSQAYIISLTTSFNELLGSNEDVVNRMIFGSTLKREDINQRVFSKLTNDLKRQLDELRDASS